MFISLQDQMVWVLYQEPCWKSWLAGKQALSPASGASLWSNCVFEFGPIIGAASCYRLVYFHTPNLSISLKNESRDLNCTYVPRMLIQINIPIYLVPFQWGLSMSRVKAILKFVLQSDWHLDIFLTGSKHLCHRVALTAFQWICSKRSDLTQIILGPSSLESEACVVSDRRCVRIPDMDRLPLFILPVQATWSIRGLWLPIQLPMSKWIRHGQIVFSYPRSLQ